MQPSCKGWQLRPVPLAIPVKVAFWFFLLMLCWDEGQLASKDSFHSYCPTRKETAVTAFFLWTFIGFMQAVKTINFHQMYGLLAVESKGAWEGIYDEKSTKLFKISRDFFMYTIWTCFRFTKSHYRSIWYARMQSMLKRQGPEIAQLFLRISDLSLIFTAVWCWMLGFRFIFHAF